MNKIFIISIVLLSLLLLACSKSETQAITPTEAPSTKTAPIEIVATAPLEVPIEVNLTSNISAEQTLISCTNNNECRVAEYCVNHECKTLASLYDDDCERKCQAVNVTITTNDGKTIILAPGKGSYTAAGAIEWDILRLPPYCPSDDLKIPLKIYKRNYGKELGNEVITLEKSQSSDVITHPTDKSIKFTLRVDDIQEVCA